MVVFKVPTIKMTGLDHEIQTMIMKMTMTISTCRGLEVMIWLMGWTMESLVSTYWNT